MQPMNKKKLFLLTSTIALVTMILTAATVIAVMPTNIMTIGSGVYPGAPSYTIFLDNGMYYATNQHGAISCASTNASYTIETAIANMDNQQELYLKGNITITNTINLINREFLTIRFDNLKMTSDDPAFYIVGRYTDEGVKIEGTLLEMSHNPFTDKAVHLRATHTVINIGTLTVSGGIVSSGTGVYLTGDPTDLACYFNEVTIGKVIGFTTSFHLLGSMPTETIGHNVICGKILYHNVAFTGVKLEETNGSYVSNNLVYRTLYQSQVGNGDIAYWNSGVGIFSGNELFDCQVTDLTGTGVSIWNNGTLRVIGGDCVGDSDASRITNTGTLRFYGSMTNTKIYGDTQWNDGGWLVSDLNRDSDSTWTDLDLSSLSPTLKVVTLNIKINPDAVDDTGFVYIQFRQKGATDNEAHYPTFLLGVKEVTAGIPLYCQLQCGVNAVGVLQYFIAVNVDWQIDTYISVVAYSD